MTIAIPDNKPLISILFCGGTGYNTGKRFIDLVKSNEILSKTVAINFVDTSTSNNSPANTPTNTMVVGTGSGSGKKRGANAKDIRAEVPKILHTFVPGVFNINVGGASGGSGGTIVNELSREMMKRSLNCVNVMIGSLSSRTEIENTHKTLQSFALAAQKFQRPALLNFLQNTKETPRAAVDANILNNLVLMCLFFSGTDDKIDEADISNLLNYPVLTSFQPSVVGFDLFLNELRLERHEMLYAVGTLAKEGTDTDVEPSPEYQVAGYVHGATAELFADVNAMHWAVLGNSFGPLMALLSEKVDAFEAASAAHTVLSLIPEGHNSGDDDLVV